MLSQALLTQLPTWLSALPMPLILGLTLTLLLPSAIALILAHTHPIQATAPSQNNEAQQAIDFERN